MKMRFKLIALLLVLVMVLPMVVACTEPVMENTPAEDKVPGAGELTEAPEAVQKADAVAALLTELLQQSKNVSSEKVEIKGKYKGSISSSFLTPEPEKIYESEEWVEFDMTFLNALLGADASAPIEDVLAKLILGGSYEDGDELLAGIANSLDFSKIEAEYGSLENFMTASSASTVCLAIVSALAESESFANLPPELQAYVLTLSENATDFALKLANGTADFETFFDFIVPESDFGAAIDAIRSTWDGEGNENLEIYFVAFKEYIPYIYYAVSNANLSMMGNSDIVIDALTEYLGSENGPFANGDFAGVLLAFYGAAVSEYVMLSLDSLLFATDSYYYDMVSDRWYNYYGEDVVVPEGFNFVVNNVHAFVLDDAEYIDYWCDTYEDACALRDEYGLDCAVLQYCEAYLIAEGNDRDEALVTMFDAVYGTVCDVIDAGEYENDTKLALVLGALTHVLSKLPVEDNESMINFMLSLQLNVAIFGNKVAEDMRDVIIQVTEDNKYGELYGDDALSSDEILSLMFGPADPDGSTVDVLVQTVIYLLNGDMLPIDGIMFDGIPVAADLGELIEKLYTGEFDGMIGGGLACAMITAATWAACKTEIDEIVNDQVNIGLENGYITEDEVDYIVSQYRHFLMRQFFFSVADDVYSYLEVKEEYEFNGLEVLGFIYAIVKDVKADAEDVSPYANVDMLMEIGSADVYFVAMIACDIMEPLHRAKAERYAPVDLDPEMLEEYVDGKVEFYEQTVISTVVALMDSGISPEINLYVPMLHICYILDAYEYPELQNLCMMYAMQASSLFEDEYMGGAYDAEDAGATEYITEADVPEDSLNKKAYVLGYNAYVDGNTEPANEMLYTMSLADAYEYVYLPFIFEAEGMRGTVLGELIYGFYYVRDMEIDFDEAEAYSYAIRNVYNDAVNDGMAAAEILAIVAYYVGGDAEEGSVEYTFAVNMMAIAETVADEDFDFSKDALYAVMLKQFYGENEYVDAVIELIGTPGKESVRANLKLLVSLLIDDGKGDIFVDIAVAAFTGDKAELLALLEELSGVEDYALGSTAIALVAHYLGQFGSIDEDIATIIEAYQIYGIATDAIEELFGEVLYPDFTEVIAVISDALNAESVNPVHLALDIMVAEGVFDGIAIPDKSYDYYYEELIALLGAFNVFMQQGLNFYDAKNCANVTLLVLTDMENIEDYALRLLTVEEKLYDIGSRLWVVYAGLSTVAHLEYEDASIVDWERVLDYIEILVPEMTVQNYAALANLLRDAAETVVTDVTAEITLVTHNELETVYEYTIVGTVSAEDIFECELNIVLEMTVSNV